jgi:CheY-like chemotaxis protein
MRILHVDDEPPILELTQFFLERTGEMTITSCCCAEEALELIGTEEFDAVISDYEMPGMNGIDLLFELRTAGITIPFIVFTGRGREDVVIEALNKGADFYIQKGGEVRSQFAELRNAIRRAVEKHRFEQEIRGSERRISDIFHHLPDATFAVDCGGRVIAWNRAMEAMTGVAAGDIIGVGGHAYALPLYGAPRPLGSRLLSGPRQRSCTIRTGTLPEPSSRSAISRHKNGRRKPFGRRWSTGAA